MSLPNFRYLAPKTVDELCGMMNKYEESCRIMAGGTDMLVRMKDRVLTPRYLIDLKKIGSLNYIHYDAASGLRIGATTTLRIIENSEIIREKFSVIAAAAHSIGSVQIRNRGTIAGNLCNAAPSADMAPALIALGSTVNIVSSSGERIVALEQFFTGPGRTVLGNDEVVTEIGVPNMEPGTGVTYYKHSLRRAMDLAIVGVAAKLCLEQNYGICSDARVVLGAVSPIVMRAVKAEDVLVGKEINIDLIEEAARAAAGECRPISDVRGSAEYRREMVRVFTKRSLLEAFSLANYQE